jgi:sugar lactone lactonase YvrE/mono/diheme cytochrome c family protein
MAGALVAGVCALAIGGSLRAQEPTPTVWDGVYTAAQAERGAATYNQRCAACHGGQLGGTGEAPGLAGAEFLSNWSGLTVGELFERIRTTMPFDAPGSLSRDAYADVLAFIFKANGLPAGAKDLDRRTEVLQGIQILAARPAGAAAPSAASAASPAAAMAQDGPRGDGAGPNGYPNPYRAETGFFQLPAGRTMGSSSAVGIDSRGHIWVADRCGQNSCAGSPLDPIMEFDAGGKFIKAFGAGKLLFPHGFHIDAQDNIWVTDGRAEGGKGYQVFKFDRNGKVLLTLGKPGVAGDGPDVFNEPNAVLTAPNGDIFVTDGHTPYKTNARVIKFDAKGKFIKQWGVHGAGPGQLEVPHALAMDSKGRLFVADRWNNRIQIYDQDGKLLDSWTQFGRPSGLFIDKNDILYSADSESRAPEGYGHNPGWKRGIRIGSVRDGVVTAFIPDTEPNPDKGATSGAEGVTADRNGVIYGAQVLQKTVVRYTK